MIGEREKEREREREGERDRSPSILKYRVSKIESNTQPFMVESTHLFFRVPQHTPFFSDLKLNNF
jgi:hypothetical protein